jgi:hypothetical protein
MIDLFSIVITMTLKSRVNRIRISANTIRPCYCFKQLLKRGQSPQLPPKNLPRSLDCRGRIAQRDRWAQELEKIKPVAHIRALIRSLLQGIGGTKPED